MAGYKQTLMMLNPLSLYSFDGEQKADDPRFLRNTDLIIDEAGGNHGHLALETDDPMTPCYYIGQAHPELDRFEQASMRFCPQGPQQYAEQQGRHRFPKAYVIAPNTAAWNFSSKEFTYVFTLRRNTTYTFDARNVNPDTRHTTTGSFMDVYFEHHGVCSVGQIVRYASPAQIWVKVPGCSASTITVEGQLTSRGRVFDKATLIVVRFKNGIVEILRDGVQVLRHDYSPNIDMQFYSIDSGTKELTIGGSHLDQGTGFVTSDRITNPTEIDQFAVFNRYLDDTEIARLYRRLFTESDLVLLNTPGIYVPFEDTGVPTTNRLQTLGSPGLYTQLAYRPEERVLRVDGPSPTKKGMLFTGSALRFGRELSPQEYILNPANNFTMMLSFRVTHGVRGALFSQQSIAPNHPGITIWANSRNKQQHATDYEMTLTSDSPVIWLGSDLDQAKWHTIIMRRTGTRFEVFLNSQRVVDMTAPWTSSGGSYSTSMLSVGPDNPPINAELHGLMVFDYALSDIILKAFTQYESIYHVRGTVTIHGTPAAVAVRVYDHLTGELIGQTRSNPDTGVWIVHLPTNTPVDVITLDREDVTVRLKGYGPIIPYEMFDDPYRL